MSINKVLGVHRLCESNKKTVYEVRCWIKGLYKQIGVYDTYKEAVEAKEIFDLTERAKYGRVS